LGGNNNFNNLSPVNLFKNLGRNNLPPPSPSANLFENIEERNLSPNNNNNPLLGELNPNVAVLINALIEMNLIGGHYPREGSFIKLTEFGGTETENPNEWLERFNKIAKANQ